MKNPKGQVIFSLLLLFLSLPGLKAAEEAGRIEVRSWIDWIDGTFILETSYFPSGVERPSPGLRQHAMMEISRNLPLLFLNEISHVQVDSRNTLGDLMDESAELTRILLEIGDRGNIDRAAFNADFSCFTQMRHYRLYPDLIDLLMNPYGASAQTAELQYIPSGNYSGIVIDADGLLPVYGTSKTARLQPALFPNIYNADMELLFEKHMVDPVQLRIRGMVQYVPADEIERIHSRVGETPLFVHATKLHGIQSTDLIVSDRSGRRLRADENMLSLLREGKIVVLHSAEQSSASDHR